MPLVEREAEVAEVLGALSAAAEGRGTALRVEGEAGIGKSALLDDARAAAAGLGLRVLTARAQPLERGFAFGVARQLLARELLGASEARRARLLQGAAGLAAPVLLDAGSSADTTAALHGLTWLVTALADEAPLLLCVDDLHWSDAPSRALLAAVAARVGELPVALIVAARPVPDAARSQADAALAAATRAVRPARLSPAGVAAVLRDTLGEGRTSVVPRPDEEGRTFGAAAGPHPAFVAAVHAATGGTPFLVRAVADAAARRGVAPTAEAAAAVETVGAAAVTPEVAQRLGALAPEAVLVAQALAVAGDGSAPALLAGIAEMTLDEVHVGLAALRGSGLLSRGEAHAFEHALVRAAVLDGLGEPARRELHGRAGRLRAADGDFERAAAHVEEAPAAGDPAVVDLLDAVARSARRRGDPQRAVDLLRRALAEPPPPDRRAALLLRLGRLEVAANDPAGPDRLAAAAAAAPDPTQRLRAALARGQGLTVGGRWRDGLAAMREAVAAADAEGADADARRFARVELVSELLPVRADARAREEREAVLREAITGSGDDLDRLATGVLAFHRAIGRPVRGEVVELAMGALAHGIVPGVRSPAALHPLFALICAGATDLAEPGIAAVVAATRARGSETLVRTVSAWHAMALLYEDRLAEAEQAALDADPGASGGMLAVAQLLGASVRGVLALERGDLAAASAALDPPLESEPELADTIFADGFLVARGRLRFAEGDPATAHRLATEAGARLTATGAESPGMTQWRRDASRYALALGRREEALALADEEVAAARALGATRPLAAALRVRAAAAHDVDERRALLDEALGAVAGTSLDVERARTLLALAPLQDGDLRRETLRLALDAAWRAGAVQAADEARAALVAAGGRPRRAALTGALALTPAEARTAGLAAEGRTNREIAEVLFLTRSTVEGHLTSAYRKLGIKRRDELAAALA